jgi:hypothetical protein
VSATDGDELGPLLDEQRAYDRALAPDYLDQGLDLPGGDDVAEALDAFQPTGNERVRFVAADLFTWTPDRRYDVVFFGFWLSHVPAERFASFSRTLLLGSRKPRHAPDMSVSATRPMAA